MADSISTGPMMVIAEQLAGRIRAAHQAASTAAQTALGHALEAGRLLAEAREAVPHGGWGDYVASCGIADRTASLYMRLHRHRDRLEDRQRVADLSVRQAARLLAEPKAKGERDPDGGNVCTDTTKAEYWAAQINAAWGEAVKAKQALVDRVATILATEVMPPTERAQGERILREAAAELAMMQAGTMPGESVTAKPRAPADRAGTAAPVIEGSIIGEAPAWYRPGHRHAGTHPSGACFMVWPHPAGEPWVHAFFVIPHDPASPKSGGLLEGPKRGIRVDRLLWLFDFKRGGGLPDMRDPTWLFSGDPQPVTPEEIAAEPDYNTWLFSGPDDYRRRGMGIVTATPKEEGKAFLLACMAIAKAIPAHERRELFDASREHGTRVEPMPAVPPVSEQAQPSWYRPSALVVAAHPSEGPTLAWVEVWPHPRDGSRAHVYAHVKTGDEWTHYTAPPDGYLPQELETVLVSWCESVGLSWVDRASWLFTHGDMKADEAAALNGYLQSENGHTRRPFKGKEVAAMQSYLTWPARRAARQAGKAVKK